MHPGKQIRVIFSTPSRYFAAAYFERAALPTISYSGDLLPYADDDHSYWTGFYGTRPALKTALRRAEAALHAANWLVVLAHASAHHGVVRWLASLEGEERRDEHLHAAFETLTQCRRAVALLQHHDAITGTSRTQVVAGVPPSLHADCLPHCMRIASLIACRLPPSLHALHAGGGRL